MKRNINLFHVVTTKKPRIAGTPCVMKYERTLPPNRVELLLLRQQFRQYKFQAESQKAFLQEKHERFASAKRKEISKLLFQQRLQEQQLRQQQMLLDEEIAKNTRLQELIDQQQYDADAQIRSLHDQIEQLSMEVDALNSSIALNTSAATDHVGDDADDVHPEDGATTEHVHAGDGEDDLYPEDDIHPEDDVDDAQWEHTADQLQQDLETGQQQEVGVGDGAGRANTGREWLDMLLDRLNGHRPEPGGRTWIDAYLERMEQREARAARADALNGGGGPGGICLPTQGRASEGA